MSTVSLPFLLDTTPQQENIDRLGWTDGQSLTAYGLRFGLRSNTPTLLEQAAPHLPLGWQLTPTGEVDILVFVQRPH